MNEANRQKVLDFLSEQDDISPLYFHGYESNKEEFDPNKYSVKDMVRRALELAKLYASYNSKTGDYESSRDRWRSSLDIWRHIVYYYPTIEIFDVMHVLYEWYHKAGGVCGQFCGDVERRTFRNTDYDDSGNYMTPRFLRAHNNVRYDEYGLDWDDWKDI